MNVYADFTQIKGPQKENLEAPSFYLKCVFAFKPRPYTNASRSMTLKSLEVVNREAQISSGFALFAALRMQSSAYCLAIIYQLAFSTVKHESLEVSCCPIATSS